MYKHLPDNNTSCSTSTQLTEHCNHPASFCRRVHPHSNETVSIPNWLPSSQPQKYHHGLPLLFLGLCSSALLMTCQVCPKICHLEHAARPVGVSSCHQYIFRLPRTRATFIIIHSTGFIIFCGWLKSSWVLLKSWNRRRQRDLSLERSLYGLQALTLLSDDCRFFQT